MVKKGAATATSLGVGSVKGALAGKSMAQALQEQAEQEAAKQALKAAGFSETQLKGIEQASALSGGFSKTMASIKHFFTVVIPAAFLSMGLWISQNKLLSLLILLVIITAILGILYWTGYWKLPVSIQQQASETEKKSNALNALIANSAEDQKRMKEGFADAPAEPIVFEEQTLVNLQPLTIKQAGFLGPAPTGSFDAEKATGQALKAGFRCLVLQIDYLKAQKDKAKFPEPGVPTLLYKSEDGSVLSANAGSIEGVAKTIASLAFRPEVPNFASPVILYLHVLRAPSAVREKEEHIRYLSRIARALNPLAPYHLGVTPFGVFHRQKQEKALLNTPLKSLEGQVILLSNADTTIFRSPNADGTRYDPADDLDFWVNMRVYLHSEDDVAGVAKVPDTGVKPAAVVVSLTDILDLSAAKKEAFAIKGKSRLVIAMTDPLKNPTSKEVSTAINELGVNMVPLDIVTDDIQVIKGLVDEYSNQTYRPKPTAIRNI